MSGVSARPEVVDGGRWARSRDGACARLCEAAGDLPARREVCVGVGWLVSQWRVCACACFHLVTMGLFCVQEIE